jgi:BirA family biotin operon repressor/biotin-[acetyl-CoA-carboxylase] ligase
LSCTQPDHGRADAVPPDLRDALAASHAARGRFGASLHFHATVGSTNDVAARLAEAGAPEGTTVVAEEQTAGRGRSGRTWFSAAGAGLYVSVIIRPESSRGTGAIATHVGAGMPAQGGDAAERVASPGVASAEPLGLLTLAAGVALAAAVQEATGLQADIKWPNDLLCGRRKLAGILAEASLKGEALEAVIVGLGINIRHVAYPPELAGRTTSIEAELGRPVDRGLVLACVLARLASIREALARGDSAAVLDQWRRLSPSSVGRAVSWKAQAGSRHGTTAGIDADGALLVDADGVRERIIAGEVLWS